MPTTMCRLQSLVVLLRSVALATTYETVTTFSAKQSSMSGTGPVKPIQLSERHIGASEGATAAPFTWACHVVSVTGGPIPPETSFCQGGTPRGTGCSRVNGTKWYAHDFHSVQVSFEVRLATATA